ncbi:membrane protein [Pelistega indica]|uniref:Membrane protein n=1 Tax=Pelistega indica TaxID=1414851 RepID=V8FQU5_9BURK|nr:DUF924 family protein [Pelistega indica]ETD66669.1 membrane protein [Pelistega indica]
MQAQAILDFWFKETGADQWFTLNESFDNDIRARFHETWVAATQDKLLYWRKDIFGRLAEIIVLDQFSRNMFRDSAEAYAHDAKALALSHEALYAPDFFSLSRQEADFLLMPFMHSEDLLTQHQSLILFKNYGTEEAFKFAEMHKDIIEKFGRFPHRNRILGRESTEEELQFLQTPNNQF